MSAEVGGDRGPGCARAERGGLFHREVTRYLREIRFPADRRDLQRAAAAAGAGPAVLARLDGLDDCTYDGMAQVEEVLDRLGPAAAATGRLSVDALSEESFPASDPPGGAATGVGEPDRD